MTVDSKKLGFLVPPTATTKPTPDSLISTEDISKEVDWLWKFIKLLNLIQAM